jgi:hypothetical protein
LSDRIEGYCAGLTSNRPLARNFCARVPSNAQTLRSLKWQIDLPSPVLGNRTPTTPEEAGQKSKESIGQAKRNLETADLLAAHDKFPEAFEYVVSAAEEATRSLFYYYVSLEVLTFNPTRAREMQYYKETDLFDHERKYAFFAALEMMFAMLDLITRTLRGTKLPEEGIAKMEAFNRSMEQVEHTPEAAGRVLGEYLPGLLEVIEGVALWESARQAARYSGEDREGKLVVPATKEEFDRFRPIVGRRVESLVHAYSEPVDSELVRGVRELFRQERLSRKGSKPPREGRNGRRSEGSRPDL